MYSGIPAYFLTSTMNWRRFKQLFLRESCTQYVFVLKLKYNFPLIEEGHCRRYFYMK